MEIHSVRIAEHGPVQTPTMSYSQRQPQNHRPNHSQATSDIYKPSRSPLPNPARYPYPASPAQLPPQAQATINQVQVSAQRYGQVAPPPQQQQQPQAQHQPPPPAAVFQNAGYRDYRSQRISLLHPEYASGRAREAQLQGVVHLDGQAGQQPIKKIRLQDHKDVIQPLRIDTREQPGTYNPQVEAISPTLPDHLQQEEQTFRTTKDELIQQIGKVDREIAKAESQITILKKKEKELDEIANNKPSVKSEVEEDAQPKHQSLPQKIYAENRRKAQSAHAKLDALGAKVEWPLYNQPSDTAVYHDNKRKHMAFKKRLLDYFKKRHVDKDGRNGYLTETYSKLMQEWVRKVEKIENTTKRKAKEAKNREFFEKVFPELRKQREDKERFNRVGARVKSEADMEEIMDNLQEQAMEDKKMRSYAVIPPILLDSKERKLTYQDNNGFIDDMEMVYKSRQFLNIWTPSEKEIFKEKYLQHPKNFGVIASFIERKTVSDCVQYYYLSKKTENYKQLLRKSRQRTRSSRNNSQKVTSANTSVVDILTTGVTTRLQREQQQQRTVVQQSRAEAATTSSDTPPTHSTAASNSISTPSIATALTTSSSSTAVTSLSSTATSSSSLSTCSTTPPATTPTVISTNTSSNNTSQLTTATTTIVTSIIATNSSTTTPSTNNSSSIISTNSVPVMSTTTIVVTSNSSGCNINNNNNNNNNSAGGGGGGNSPKLLNDNNSIIIEHSTTTVNNSISKCDFNNVVTTATTTTTSTSGGGGEESYHRSSGGSSNQAKFFGDDAKVDGNNGLATAGDAVHDGVVVTIKKEVEPSQDIASDQTASSASTTIAENKKKKERRKDKENANVETSDDDDDDNNAEIPDKSIQGSCIVCTAQLGPHLQSRPLVPSHATQYGLHEDQIPPNGRVCNTCRCKCVRSRYTHCPLPACPNSRGRVKRLRSFPQRLQDLPSDVRDPLLAEFHVPSGVTKCCSACFNRIQRRLGPAEEWADDEIQQLKHALTELGASWQTIADRLNKSPQQVRSFYAANRKRLALEACLGDRKPALTDEEESGSSTSSCEEPLLRERHSSDTASAAESPPSIPANPSQPIKKEDYDSSATETADEAQTPDHYQGSATITPVTNDGQPKQNASPLSVRELVLNVIEFQLMKNPGGVGQIPSQNPPTSGMAPTISSILSSNDSNDVTIVNEYNLNQVQQTRPRNDLSLAKLVTPLIGATITPVPASHQQQQQQQAEQMRDDLVVVQVQDGGREPETLDLSLKKPRELPPPPHKLQQQQQQQHHREYIYHERKSQAFGVRQPQPKLPSPKPANPKSGSITLGTPIINQPRYEGLLRQLPPEAKMGSITQGTPIHLPQHMQQQQQQEKRVYDFFKQQQQQQRGNQVQVQPQPPPPPPSSGYQYRQPAYTVEQQLTSRQIIMNDYITSQQMYRRNEKQYYQQQQQQQPQQANSPVLHRTPPPPLPSQNQANQQRQGVIQRHTRPQYLPPGHEALSSLVDVAVQQPSLPVPSAPHEGLGKTMADNIMEQPHRFQVLQQQHLRQQQQRMMEEQQRRIVYQNQNPRQQQQQVRNQSGGDSSTSLTAASLIDAIITHQINQTSEGGREIMTNQREPRAGDLLFQGFHPPQQQQQQQQTSREENNVDRPSSVISIDLEAVPEPLNKNLTVKELTDSVISHDFSARPQQQQQQAPPPSSYYMQQQQEEQWKRRLKEEKRSGTPQQQQDERQIIRIAQSQQQQQQQQKFHVEPVSPPDNHWSNEQSFRRYPQQVVQQQQQQQQQSGQQQQHMSPLDYVKNRIVEVMRTEDDKKDDESKERSESPGDMVIDEEKHEEFSQNSQQQQQQQSGFGYSFIHKENTANDTRNNEPKPLLSAQYEPLSDED